MKASGCGNERQEDLGGGKRVVRNGKIQSETVDERTSIVFNEATSDANKLRNGSIYPRWKMPRFACQNIFCLL